MKSTNEPRTRYETVSQAIADGWRRVNPKTDKDTSGYPWVGYEFTTSDGTESTTIFLSKAKNKNSHWPGASCQMFRAE